MVQWSCQVLAGEWYQKSLTNVQLFGVFNVNTQNNLQYKAYCTYIMARDETRQGRTQTRQTHNHILPSKSLASPLFPLLSKEHAERSSISMLQAIANRPRGLSTQPRFSVWAWNHLWDPQSVNRPAKNSTFTEHYQNSTESPTIAKAYTYMPTSTHHNTLTQ